MTSSPAAGLPKAPTRHIPSLDGIRAISVILVFLAHAGLDKWIPGGFGVTVFFFLSGFLITTLLRVEFERHGRISLRNFWMRRALRILPPFYLVLAAATLITLALGNPGEIAGKSLVAQALQFANYWTIAHGASGQAPGTVVYWSLAVEEHYYLVFPWIFLLLARARLQAPAKAAVLWGLCGAILAWRLYLVLVQQVPIDRTYMGSDTRFDSILFGCALALWRNPALDPPTPRSLARENGLLGAALLVLMGTFLVRDPLFRETLRYSIQGAALTVIFTQAVRRPKLPLFRVLNWRPFVKMGELSYAFYLVHFSTLFLVWRALPRLGPAAQALLAFALALGFAGLIYHYVERPCAKLRQRLSA